MIMSIIIFAFLPYQSNTIFISNKNRANLKLPSSQVHD